MEDKRQNGKQWLALLRSALTNDYVHFFFYYVTRLLLWWKDFEMRKWLLFKTPHGHCNRAAADPENKRIVICLGVR